MVLGMFALGRLSINLLPNLIYPQIGIRILDPGVSSKIMEDRVTRQVEEQMAITEDVVSVESRTTEGTTRVDLHFEYGKDIDIALRDAATRLDRAKRFLPATIEPPIIFKYDPAQIPVMEYIVSSSLMDSVKLRHWTDYDLSKKFLNLPGVASIEVGGGLEREIHILLDQRRLAGLGLSMEDVIKTVREGNQDIPSGRLLMGKQEYSSRTAGRLTSVDAIAGLPIPLASAQSVPLSEVAQVIDTHEDERLRVRYNGVPGVKISVQKQPDANTVEVANLVKSRLAWLRANKLLPEDINVDLVSDQSIYVHQSLNNAARAAMLGALLAMFVVYMFIGSIRGTLIIGSAIPISIMATFVLMSLGGLTFNIMTLGGLALGIGMLIDNTIVMLENIARHQSEPKELAEERNKSTDDVVQLDAGQVNTNAIEKSVEAAKEVNSAIVAATSTNLAAVLPFLFVGGLVGLLFRELIFTISAAILASLVVALTLVPSLAARMSGEPRGRLHGWVRSKMKLLQGFYANALEKVIKYPRRILASMFLILLVVTVWVFDGSRQEFLPQMDDGRVSVRISVDTGTSLDEMDQTVQKIEKIIHEQGDVKGIFTLVGGRIFGRTERQTSSRSSLSVQLVSLSDRDLTSSEWAIKLRKAVSKAQIAGVKLYVRARGVRGVRISRGDDDVSFRVEGPDLATLSRIGSDMAERLHGIEGLRNIKHSAEDVLQEFAIKVDRKRAIELGIGVAQVGRALRIALEGIVIGDFLDGDRSYNIRVRLPRQDIDSPHALGNVLLFGESRNRPAVYLRDVAQIEIVSVPAEIKRDNQLRIVEVTGSLTKDVPLGKVTEEVRERINDYSLPSGYKLYFTGSDVTLQEGKHLVYTLAGLALFLVFVVMAVQYESLRNPTIIMLCVPFSLIGVSIGILLTGINLSMPVWLGIIMLIGIVVNNSIILVEYIEILQEKGRPILDAILEAGRLRLRPILMTTLTTVTGMAPLALGLGEGAEMLQPLAITIVAGLSFSVIVSLFLVPTVYWLFWSGSGNQDQAQVVDLRPVA